MRISISIDQLDELDRISGALESVLWMCHGLLRKNEEGDDKTAEAVHTLLSPWHSRLGDLIGELAEKLSETHRERQEHKEREAGPDYFSRSQKGED